MSKVFHFSYQGRPHNPRFVGGVLSWTRDLHRVRDGHAMLELMAPLAAAGYTFGDTILNLSWERGDGPAPAWDEQTDPVRERDDLIVMTTRCPLDDRRQSRKQISPSSTPLEQCIFSTVRKCFLRTCSRRQVEVNDALADLLRARGCRSSFSFIERQGVTEDEREAYGFLLFAPALLPMATPSPVTPSRLLVSFGMAGIENWLWARMLRRRFSGLLRDIACSSDYWFVVARWAPPTIPERPLSLQWSDKATPKLVAVARCSNPLRGTPWRSCNVRSDR
jgi:hypothetical protein